MIRLGTVLVLSIIMTATLNAQGRGGGRGAGARGGGTIEHAVVHGKALEGNRDGDSPDRNVTIYLPPSYAADSARQFPVVYFLHDFGAHSDDPITAIKPFADRLAAVQGFSEPIIVTPDAATMKKSSMYSNGWDAFIAEDLVAYIDGHYRTLAKRISRGLAGQSMGGYGALRIGMKRPDVFSSIYSMSACCLNGVDSTPEAKTIAPLSMLEQNAPNLKKLYSIAIDIGTKDEALATNRQLHDALRRLYIPHYYEEYDGGERFERNLLPFFSKNLAAPANPTSPGVQ